MIGVDEGLECGQQEHPEAGNPPLPLREDGRRNREDHEGALLAQDQGVAGLAGAERGQGEDDYRIYQGQQHEQIGQVPLALSLVGPLERVIGVAQQYLVVEQALRRHASRQYRGQRYPLLLSLCLKAAVYCFNCRLKCLGTL